MYFIVEFPKTKVGFTAILVVVDRLSKMLHFVPGWNDIKVQEVTARFLRDIFAKHGLPQKVATDRGSEITSHFWKAVAKLLGVKRCLSRACQPQTDGQTERTNRTLEHMLTHVVTPSHDDWDIRLPCLPLSMLGNSLQAVHRSC